MIELELIRWCYAPFGTFGSLSLAPAGDAGGPLATVEAPWRNNEVDRSCIPDGFYLCQPRRYNRGDYDAIEVCGVPGRSLILFHKGNRPTDVTGCIVVGVGIAIVDDDIKCYSSAQAFDRLMAAVGGQHFTLRIKPTAGAVVTPAVA